MIDIINRYLKNRRGELHGFGGCAKCGDRWNWKDAHTVYYSEHAGGSPLCEECWNKTTKEEKLRYYLGQLYKYDRPDFDYEKAEQMIRKQIDAFDSSAQSVKEEEIE